MESVLNQTFQDWELVIVDNASTDATGEIARSYADPRITVYTNDATLAMPENWNMAVSKARGRLVKLLPADDLLRPECLEVQVKDFDAHPGVSLVACRRDFVDIDGSVVLAGRGLVGLVGELDPTVVIHRIIRSGVNPIGEPAAYLFRREDFITVGAFDPTLPYPIDLVLAAQLLRLGRFYGQFQPLAAFRIRGDSYTAGDINAQGVEHRILLHRLANDGRWEIGRFELWRGLARTHVAGYKRKLLYRAVASRLPLMRRLPGLVLGDSTVPVVASQPEAQALLTCQR